jgi:hypothetical protein
MMNYLLLVSLFLFLGRETHAFLAFRPNPVQSKPPSRTTTSNSRIFTTIIIEQQYRNTNTNTNNNNVPLRLSSNDDNDNDNEDDDDGWGVEISNSRSSSRLEEKAQKLRQLQRESASQSKQQQRRQPIDEPPERDLFIPIFAIVSLMGLFGTYAYEMARLASRGELYLPWDN